ncbi:putative GMP synthase [glutamine-hydrolyzing] [Toxocara canis]|uniref:Putative GMP synthase [glutamine-hydrolyzing] n=1 Tax=Toxocara canis TaxID=6265 RepID=A0A0B2UQN8_TOXCA|nr:putative GMP synthase [glutamine-hydrolyzing] [Toxocara canis]
MVSGGVDSTVCAALMHKALGPEKVIAIHIDNGFMRYKESDRVIEALNKLNLSVKRYNAFHSFISGTVTINGIKSVPLRRVTQPELKRRIIGDTFMRVKDSVMEEVYISFILIGHWFRNRMPQTGEFHSYEIVTLLLARGRENNLSGNLNGE